MNLRKSLAIFVAVVMVFGSFSVSFAATDAEVTATATNTVTFTDVTDHWGAAAIQKWAGYGIINGFEGAFRPDDSITRGEMAVIFDNMMDYQETAKNTFTDLQSGQFYTDAILKANAAGIVKGDGTTVRPTDKITKEEAAVMMSRAFAVAEANTTKSFADASAVSSWAKSAVFGMEAKGYVSGYEGNFNPKSNITRAEVVTMINNIVKAYYTTAGTYTENVVGTAVVKVTGVTLKGITVSENLIIAEGVAQGDATLDSVTVKGNTVVRGGGENSIHIIGTSSLTKITIQKDGDKLRISIEGTGVSVPDVVVDAGEEIVITGNVGTVDLQASDATVYATAAEIKSASISGDNSKIIVDAKSAIDSVSVASTAKNTAIETEKGAVVKSVTAAAPVSVSGTGTVTKVTLNEGADGSKVTTPSTSTTVSSGVSEVTGAGGKAISAGSTATNNTSSTDITSTTTTSGGGGGGSSDSRATGTLQLIGVTGNGLYKVTDTTYHLSTGSAINNLSANITGSGFTAGSSYTVTVTLSSPGHANSTAQVTVLGSILNQNITTTVANLETVLGATISNTSDIEAGTIFNELQARFDRAEDGDVITVTIGGTKVTSMSFTITKLDIS